ncbi:hypothetical protein MXD59_00005, partial [Frankia sp. Ag45/Mut15]
LRRQLAADSPDAYLPDLAASLNNLANRLSEVGQDGEDLAAGLISEFPVRWGQGFLLCRRAAVTERPFPRRAADAIAALEILDGEDAPEALAEVHGMLRELLSANPASFDQFWTAVHPGGYPGWLVLPDAVLRQVVDWLNAPTIRESAAYLESHRDLLGPAGVVALDEIGLRFPHEPRIEAHRQLLATAITEGVGAAYAPLLASDVP